MIGNWTITLSVNFGFASLLAGIIYINYPDLNLQPWHLLLIFYAVLLFAFIVCALMNDLLPVVDTLCAGFTVITILVTLIAVSSVAAAGRNSPADTLGAYKSVICKSHSFRSVTDIR